MEKNAETFDNCRCPHCKRPLDNVSTHAEICPHCATQLDPTAVWSTHRYPGIILLPWWVGLFGWPLLLTVAGIALLIQRNDALGHLPSRDWGVSLGTLLTGIGLGWLIKKFAMKGDE